MTKGEIDRLGDRIGVSSDISPEDLERLQAYRQTFKEPISRVFNFVLKAARKIDRQCIVTYRIKRIDTIIEKVRRFRDNPKGQMKLSRMWDIAGCRCILNISDVDRIYALQDILLREYGFDCKLNDRIAKPEQSGYRSLHIYVKDKITHQPVEIQIRNREQHNWATLVEIVDLLYGTKQKEEGSQGDLGRFLSLYSRASTLSDTEFSEMLKTERRMKVFERMSDVLTNNYLNIRKQWLKQKALGSYYVIKANKSGSVIISFPSFDSAEEAYYREYQANMDSNIVLTHLTNPDFNQISMAYSNYVLAMHAFFDDYRVLVANKIVDCVRQNNFYQFYKDFNIYYQNLICHFNNLSLEVNSISACSTDRSISKNQINKWFKEIKDRIILWQEETNRFVNNLAIASRGNRMKKWMIKNRLHRMQKTIKRIVNHL